MKVVLDPGAKLPIRAHRHDAGLDLFAKEDMQEVEIPPCESRIFDTGVHLAIPKNFVGFVRSKSGLMTKHQILTDGTIDSGYTGTIAVALFNHGEESYTVKPGSKIAQLVIVPCCLLPLEEADALEDTARGSKGFGSTGAY